jgi:hypothetical protein
MAPTAVVTSQIRSPNRDDYITTRGSISVKGIAWPEGTEPPYITDDLFLSVERTTDRAHLLSWSSLASASFYLVEEATNPQFSGAETIYFGVDTEYPHGQPSDGTYYYRVKADAVGVDTSRWSNVVSVSVPWTQVSMKTVSADISASGTVTVQVRIGEPEDIESSTWHTANTTETIWGGWDWSYQWDLPEREETLYLIQTRASEEGPGFGPEDTITVTLDNQNYFVYLPAISMRWPPVPHAPSLDDISNPEQDGSYTVVWSYGGTYPDETEPDTYTLQEATQADLSDWTTVYEGANTSFAVSDQPGGTYYYRVRGSNTYGPGEWSEVKSTTVQGAPLAPTLQEILNDDEDQSYRVSWSYDESYPEATTPDSYTLQEAEDPDFTEAVRDYDPATEEDCVVDADGGYCDLDNDSGTYYYRVRGQNQDGAGPWSNTEEVYVWGYDDDFSDYKSGWPRLWERTRGALYQVRPYEHPDCGSNKDCKYEDGDGYVIARRAEEKPRAQFTPDIEVPSTHYELEVDARWFEASYRATYEIYFSAEDDFDSYYAVKVRIDNPNKPSGKPPECEYRVYKHEDGKDIIFTDEDWRKSDSIHCGVVLCRDGESCGSTAWNEWKIRREGNRISVEVNGDSLGSWKDNDPFGSDRVFGVGATNYEGFTPSKPVFDNFEVELED